MACSWVIVESMNTSAVNNHSPRSSSGYAEVLKYSYVAVSVDPSAMESLNRSLEGILGENFATLKANRDDRDGFRYHMTVMRPKEFRTLKKELKAHCQVITIPSEACDFEILGIGSAKSDLSETWFAVCRSEVVDAWRNAQGLAPLDLHITLAFGAGGDVHGVSKGVETLLAY